MKAIILARVSDKKQDSNDAQVSRLLEFTKSKVFLNPKIYELEESSTKATRKKFQEIIKEIEQSKESTALFTDTIDRLQRSFKESVMLDDLIKSGKLELYFYRENLVINKNSNSADMLRWDMGVMFARSYVLQLSDNVKRKIEEKIKQGKWMGKAPIGYINVGEEKRKDIIPDPGRNHFISQIFNLYSSGNYSIRQITEKMREFGLTGTAEGKALKPSMIYSILKNPFYYGMMRIKNNLYSHKYQPLIPKNLFDRCQEVMSGYHRKPFKYASKPFIFRGMIKCPDPACKCTITPEIHKKHNYYHCTNYRKIHEKVLFVREEDLLNPILEVLEKIQLPDEKIREITEDLKRLNENKNQFHKQEIIRLRREYDQIENKISRLFDLRLEDKSITTDMFNDKLKELKEKQTELNEKMQLYTNADEKFYLTANTVLNLAKRAKEIFVSSEVEEKRQLLNFLLQNLTLDGKKLNFGLKTPFDTVLKANKCSTLLRRQDSNLQPSRYTYPKITFRGGLYHHPALSGSEALPYNNLIIISTPFRDSLYAFRSTQFCLSARLGSGLSFSKGFPRFHLVFHP